MDRPEPTEATLPGDVWEYEGLVRERYPEGTSSAQSFRRRWKTPRPWGSALSVPITSPSWRMANDDSAVRAQINQEAGTCLFQFTIDG